MYRIMIDDSTVSAPTLADGGFFVLSPTLSKELNKADGLTFTVSEDNPAYENLLPMQGIVTVYDDTDRVFHGRIVDTEVDFYRRKKITCEGDLAFLNDAILRPYEYEGSVGGYFGMLIDAYNASATANKKLLKGVVTVTDPNDTIVRSNESYVSVWDEAKKKLIDLLGGYLVTRRAFVGGNEVTYIDYLATSGVEDTQVIAFGRNLIDLTNYISGEDLYTRIIPLGATDNETQERLTIEDVNGGLDYLTNSSLESLYGRIERVVEWDDVEDAINLLNKAQAELDAVIPSTQTIAISAIDLHLLDVDTASLKVGNSYRVVSVPHGLTTAQNNNLFPLTKASISLDNPANSRYTFGRVQPAISGGI